MLYEYTYLIRANVAESQVDDILKQYKEVIEAGGGSIKAVEQWGLRNLAYMIGKNKKAYYTHLKIEAESSVINELERQMKYDSNILRYLTVRVNSFEEEKSPIMRKIERDKKVENAR